MWLWWGLSVGFGPLQSCVGRPQCLETLINIGNSEVTDAKHLVNSGEAKLAILQSSESVCWLERIIQNSNVCVCYVV